MSTAFNSISSNIDEVLSINPSANVFAFGDVIVYHNKDWLTYSVGTDGPGELCYIFLSQMTSLRWLTFLLGSQTDSLSPALLDLLISSDASICSTMAFPPWGNSDHVVVSVSFDWSNNNGSIDLKLDGSVLEEKSSFKMLGLTFYSKLNWGSYIISIAKTASKKIGALIRSMKFLSPEVALYLYKSTIHPCMEYCCHVWAGAPS